MNDDEFVDEFGDNMRLPVIALRKVYDKNAKDCVNMKFHSLDDRLYWEQESYDKLSALVKHSLFRNPKDLHKEWKDRGWRAASGGMTYKMELKNQTPDTLYVSMGWIYYGK